MFANKGDHVAGALDASQFRIEDQLCNACGGLNLGLKNIRLQRVEETLLELIGRHLIRHRLPGLDEHLVCDAFRLRGEDSHTDRWEDVEVVRLSR
jgi:hypothetical protein